MIDRFNRFITIVLNDDGSKTYSLPGITIRSVYGDDAVLTTFNSMSPVGITDSANVLIAPFDFLFLFTDEEKTQLLLSSNLIVKRAILELTAIITGVDLQSDYTISLIQYFQLIGILSSMRVQQILAGVRP